jgi:hypothetical protein
MSAENILGTVLFPDKKVELVKKIAEKTKQGKIIWQRTGQGAAADLQGKLKMNFVESPSHSLWATQPRWVIFAVRDVAGNEILKVENRTSAVPGTQQPSPIELMLILGDPLVNVVTELHNLVGTKAKGDVEKAIDVLDTL